jgi:hypothetical protein
MLVFADPVPRLHPYAPRLHDRGVALLPVWAIEYSVLRQPARAFVSAMRPGPDPKVAGVTHYGAHALRYMLPTALAGGVAGGVGALAGGGLGCVSVAGAASAAGGSVLAGAGGALAGGALAGVLAGSAAGGAGAMLSGYALAWYRRYRWRDLGELRRRESRDNQEWKVRRHWISEVERVLEWQEPPRPSYGRRGSGANGRATGAKDYELLGLPARDCQLAPPTPAELKAAFRTQSMAWHPDRNQSLPAEKQTECVERFQELLAAHKRLLKKHGR